MCDRNPDHVLDLYKELQPRECGKLARQETINACFKTNPMSVKLVGNMPGLHGNSFCHDHGHRKNIIRFIPAPLQGAAEIFAACETASESTEDGCKSKVSDIILHSMC